MQRYANIHLTKMLLAIRLEHCKYKREQIIKKKTWKK